VDAEVRTWIVVVNDAHVEHGLDALAAAHAVLNLARAVREDAQQADEVAL
jgi:hypothetical protein